jgi:hypothetical protein
MGKTTIMNNKRDDTAKIIAEMTGVDESYVRKLRSGGREAKSEKAQEVMDLLIAYERGKTKLIKAIEELIPVTSNPGKYAR